MDNNFFKYMKYKNKYNILKKSIKQKGGNSVEEVYQNKILLFSSESMNDLANDIISQYSPHIQKGIVTKGSNSGNINIQTPDGERLRSYGPNNCEDAHIINKFDTFDDGWPDLYICNHQEVKNNDVVFIASISTVTHLFEQIAIIRALVKYRAKSLKVILPYLPVGTMERISNPGEVVTADTFINILSNSIPLTSTGPVTFSIIDIHALQEQFYFSDNVLVELKSAIPVLKNKLFKIPNDKRIVIVFPDDGAYKRYKNGFTEFETIVCGKIRDGATRIVRIMEVNKNDNTDDISNKDENIIFVIVDDLTQSGGTLKKCADALRKDDKIGGVDGTQCQIYAFVTHAVFPDLNKVVTLFTSDNTVNKFFITNTIPEKTLELRNELLKEEFSQHASKFEILSIRDVVMQLICDNFKCRNSIETYINNENYSNFIKDMES